MAHNQNTKLSDESFNKLVEYATKDEVTVSHIVRQAVKAYIENREKAVSPTE